MANALDSNFSEQAIHLAWVDQLGNRATTGIDASAAFQSSNLHERGTA
jgi:hypothetical protein